MNELGAVLQEQRSKLSSKIEEEEEGKKSKIGIAEEEEEENKSEIGIAECDEGKRGESI